jgi:hypothetical protein
LDHLSRHFELGFAIPDIVATRDPLEIGPGRPDVAIVVLRQEQANRPVEPGIRVRGDELCAEWRISEHQKGRGTKLDARVGCEPGPIPGVDWGGRRPQGDQQQKRDEFRKAQQFVAGHRVLLSGRMDCFGDRIAAPT